MNVCVCVCSGGRTLVLLLCRNTLLKVTHLNSYLSKSIKVLALIMHKGIFQNKAGGGFTTLYGLFFSASDPPQGSIMFYFHL